MTRFAVLADIHGNLPALEAVLADAAARGVDAMVDLGDCVSGPLWPAETADRLMRLDLPTVRGNHDRAVAADDPAGMTGIDRFARSCLTERHLAWLRALPPRIDPFPGVAGVHGRPGSDLDYLMEDVRDGILVPASPAALAARTAGVGVALLLCGHSHRPGLVVLDSGLTVLNPGSVGCPAYYDPGPPAALPPHVSETGSPHARYAIVTVRGADAAADGRADVLVEHVAVGYDHESAARRAAETGRSDWAHVLRRGLAAPPGHRGTSVPA